MVAVLLRWLLPSALFCWVRFSLLLRVSIGDSAQGVLLRVKRPDEHLTGSHHSNRSAVCVGHHWPVLGSDPLNQEPESADALALSRFARPIRTVLSVIYLNANTIYGHKNDQIEIPGSFPRCRLGYDSLPRRDPGDVD